MAAKIFFVVCAQVFLVKLISAQCFGKGLNLAGNGLGYGGVGLAGAPGCNGLGGIGLGNLGNAAASGGGLTVTSSSPIAPSGVSVISEYVIEGPLAVAGQVPFLGAVGVEGQVPAGGQAGTAYGCGNGNVGIVSEALGGVSAPGLGAAGLSAAGLGAAGLGAAGLGAAGLGVGLGAAGPAGLLSNGVLNSRLGGCGY